MTSYAAQWILKSGERSYLTRTAINGIIEDVSDILKVVTSNVCRDLEQLCH